MLRLLPRRQTGRAPPGRLARTAGQKAGAAGPTLQGLGRAERPGRAGRGRGQRRGPGSVRFPVRRGHALGTRGAGGGGTSERVGGEGCAGVGRGCAGAGGGCAGAGSGGGGTGQAGAAGRRFLRAQEPSGRGGYTGPRVVFGRQRLVRGPLVGGSPAGGLLVGERLGAGVPVAGFLDRVFLRAVVSRAIWVRRARAGDEQARRDRPGGHQAARAHPSRMRQWAALPGLERNLGDYSHLTDDSPCS